MTTAIEKLKQKYLEEIRDAESTLQTLRTKLAMIEEVDKEVRTMELDLGSNKYARMGLTESILDAVGDLGKRGATASQVYKHIITNGFKSASQNIAVSVNGTLKRLAEAGRIERTQVDGRKVYKPKDI